MKENLEKNFSDIQKEVPIKSENSFLYDYWNAFFYLYSKNLLKNFKNNKAEVDPNLLDSIRINYLFKNDVDNFFRIKKINEDTINLNNINYNNNINLNNPINNNILNFSSLNDIQTSLFQAQNNNLGLFNNYTYPNLNVIIPNPQNDLFINQVPINQSILNNLNVNPFYSGTKVIQNTLGNEIRSNLFGGIEVNNFDPINTINVPFFQQPIQNRISLFPFINNKVSNNKIITTSIPNNFMINNNLNNNVNSNINNKIINNSKNNINKDINKIINTNSNPKIKETYLKNNNLENKKNNNINNKNKYIFKTYNNINKDNNLSKSKTQRKKRMSTESSSSLSQKQKKSSPLFNIKKKSLNKEKEQFISRKRKRYIKHNKLVFIQLSKEKEKKGKNNKNNINDNLLNLEKFNDFFQKNRKPRGSKYRGVSKNGRNWQVLIVVKKQKKYLGSYSNEEEAARAYDKIALQNLGFNAITNYDYTKEEIDEILEEKKLLNFK